MYKVIVLLSVLLLYTVGYAQSPDLTGYRIFINPGHGGYDSNDRNIPATGFWESEGNLIKGLFLKTLLQNKKAQVYMSRTTNTTADDLPLSSISAMANAANADFFLAIHSNGWDGSMNQVLTLFRGYDAEPVFPAAKQMAKIIWQKLYENGNCWTHHTEYVKGDWTFYPQWGDKVGLGVLRDLTMPGVLSEGSFHDYIAESWRMRNNDFLLHEAWGFLRSFYSFYNIAPEQTGIITGVVRYSDLKPSYYFKTGTYDEKLPVNNQKITLLPLNKQYFTDDKNNGFFLFDSINPGNYKLVLHNIAPQKNDTILVTVNANKTSLVNMYKNSGNNPNPNFTVIEPFDEITTFWQPQSSGSTVNIDVTKTRFSISGAEKIAGAGSGLLEYGFSSTNGGLVREYNTRKPTIGTSTQATFGAWIYGDLSMNQLEYWFYSSPSVNQIVVVDTIDWSGWQFKTISTGNIGGTGEKLFHSVVIRQLPNGAREGKIYIDEAQINILTSDPEINYNKHIGLNTFPNPCKQQITIEYSLPAVGNVEFYLCNILGYNDIIYRAENAEEGLHAFDLDISAQPDGMYFLKMQFKPAIGNTSLTKYFKIIKQ